MRIVAKRRGRPPKNQNNIKTKYLNNKQNKTIIEDEYDDDNSNQSSTTTNNSASRYKTRSNRKPAKSKNHQEPKKRGRKRKLDYESEEEFLSDDEFEDPVPQSDDDEDEEIDQSEMSNENSTEDEMDEESDTNLNDENDAKRRIRREKGPFLLDDKELPELKLPSSSKDLLIPQGELIRALSIYEILRHFSTTIRLTPFRFEDFCVALMINEQTYLLSEVHIALLKTLIREDNIIGTQHVPQENRGSLNIYLHLADQITWPEALKIYLSSNSKKDSLAAQVIKDCLDCQYPFASLDKKLKLLSYLCDEFLNTQKARELINLEGAIKHEDKCRECNKNGEMLMCDTCPSVFHLACLDPPLKQVPEKEWFCPMCKQNQVNGVTDCINEFNRQIPRQEPIGWDRHGRQYWFLSRRIIIEDTKSNEVWYYSTKYQFEELLKCLDAENYEENLCNTLNELKPDIVRQMTITEKLTKTAKGSRKSYLDKVNEELQSEQDNKNDDKTDSGSKLTLNDDDLRNGFNGGVQTRLKTGSLQQKPIAFDPFKNRINIYNTISSIREEDTVIVMSEDQNSLNRISKKLAPANYNVTTLFKLGFEGNYRNYQNIYALNARAKEKAKEAKNKKKNKNIKNNNKNNNKNNYNNNTNDDDDDNKSSSKSASELEWTSFSTNGLNVTNADLLTIMQKALIHLETNLTPPFTHPMWKKFRKSWINGVSNSKNIDSLGLALTILESSMKPVLFKSSWRNILGFTVLQRTTQAERDELVKKEKKAQRERQREAQREAAQREAAQRGAAQRETAQREVQGETQGENQDNSIVIEVDSSTEKNDGIKLTIGRLKHSIWKQKGEEYRTSGIGGWLWINTLNDKYRPVKPSVEKDLSVEVSNDDGKNKDDLDDLEDSDLIDISKALQSETSEFRKKYYPKLFTKNKSHGYLQKRLNMIKLERKLKESESKPNHNNQFKCKCYSPYCDLNNQNKCYSALCKTEYTERIAKEKILKKDLREPAYLKEIVLKNGVEQFADQIVPFSEKGLLPPSKRFVNNKHKSIFIPLTYELRQLGRRGGLGEISGFNYNAKINHSVWPYGLTPRPDFRTTWLWRNNNMETIHSFALQLRVFWASIRWDDLTDEPPPPNCEVTSTEDDMHTKSIIQRKDLPPFLLRSRYLIREVTIPLELPTKTREISTPNRSGLRERRRPESPQNKGPSIAENWVNEEELELWEIQQFHDKQIQLAIEQRKELEKRKLEQASLNRNQNIIRINTSNINLHTAKPNVTKPNSLIQNGSQFLRATNVNPSSSTSNITYHTIHTPNGQAIKVQTKPTFFIAKNAMIPASSTANTNSFINVAGTNNSANTYRVIRTPQLPTRLTVVPSSLNGPIVRPINAINSNANIRQQSIPFISSNLKKVSTSNTLLTTTGTIKTTQSTSSTVSTTVTNTSHPIVTTMNIANNQKNISYLRKILLPISGGNVQIINSPIRVISSTNNSNQSDGKNAIKNVSIIPNSTLVSPVNSLLFQNSPKILLQSPTTTPTTTISTISPQLLSASKAIIINPSTNLQNKSPIITNSISMRQQSLQTSSIKTTENNTNQSNMVNDHSGNEEKKDFVVTPELTQEIVRKALLHPEITPEISQKLHALQRHHQEQLDNNNFNRSSHLDQSIKNKNDYPTTPISSNYRNNSRLSRSSRYSKSRYDRDDEYIYEYRQSERPSRHERHTNHQEDEKKICQNIIRQLLDRLEKEEKRKRHEEILAERRHKKAVQMKIKYRQNHIEAVRMNILRRKSLLNRSIRISVDRNINNILNQARKSTLKEPEKFSEEKSSSNSQSKLSEVASFVESKNFEEQSKIKIVNSEKTPKLGRPRKVLSTPNDIEEPAPKRQRLFNNNSIIEEPKTSSSVVNKSKSDTIMKKDIVGQKTKNKETKSKRQVGMKTKNGKKQKKVKEEVENTCFCGKLVDYTTIIGCDNCDSWLHKECVNLTDEEIEAWEGDFYCPICLEKNPELSKSMNNSNNNSNNSSSNTSKNKSMESSPIIKKRGRPSKKSETEKQNEQIQLNQIQPNDDDQIETSDNENEKFCICEPMITHSSVACDSCDLWFHCRCMGLTKFHANNELDTYICPMCEGKQSIYYKIVQDIQDQDYETMKNIFNNLKRHQNAWPFLQPVDPALAPDYDQIIKEPIDLSMIGERISNNEYRRISEFIYDLRIMFENCRFYNGPSSIYSKIGNQLEEFFNKLLQKYSWKEIPQRKRISNKRFND